MTYVLNKIDMSIYQIIFLSKSAKKTKPKKIKILAQIFLIIIDEMNNEIENLLFSNFVTLKLHLHTNLPLRIIVSVLFILNGFPITMICF